MRTAALTRARRGVLETRGRTRPAGWVAGLARAGMVASGVLYGTVGALALGVALGQGGKTTDSGGALTTVAQQSWGAALLVLLAVGFAGYALWRFAVAAFGEKLETNEELNVAKRAWYVARGAFYAFLCWKAVDLLLGARSAETDEQEKSAELLSWPAGRWLVVAIGVGVLVYGIGSLYRGLTRKFEDDLKTHQMSRRERRWITRLGVVGYSARGLVLGLVGIFFLKAGLEYDPSESKGLDGALAEVAQQPYGGALLGVVAAGLVAYGLFRIAQARYREV